MVEDESMAETTAPDGYHTVTPYLVVCGMPALIEYLEAVFGATELRRTTVREGRVHHARVRIGDSLLMIGEASESQPVVGTVLYIYVEDVDRTYRSALEHGGRSLREPAEQYYGDRNAGVEDPFGNQWWIAAHVEDVSSEESEKRARSLGV